MKEKNDQNRSMKTVEDSLTECTRLLYPSDMNQYGRLFGGRLLQWIDETAGLVAIRHSEGVVVTAAIDNLRFKEGAGLRDIIFMKAYLVYVGNTSMEVRVDTFVEKPDGTRSLINYAYIVFVAVDEKGKPRPVPGLLIRNETEQMAWDAALKRREMHEKRKAEGF